MKSEALMEYFKKEFNSIFHLKIHPQITLITGEELIRELEDIDEYHPLYGYPVHEEALYLWTEEEIEQIDLDYKDDLRKLVYLLLEN